MSTDPRGAIEAVWRMERAQLLGGLARIVRDMDLAEELAQEALLAALEHWPQAGIPDNPGAWLMTAARHRAVDALRRRKMLERQHAVLVHEVPEAISPEDQLHDALDDDVGDDVLRLLLAACHPVLSTEARIALTLRLLGGLTTEEIARAFLLPEATIAQRIVRAKRTLSAAGVPFEVPRGEALRARLGSVLEVIYLVFNEGYAATRGEDWMRPALCEDALRLGRILTARVPDDPEVHGLVALMELQASRFDARTTATGVPILLLDQDRTRWDPKFIQRGFAALARSASLGQPLGPYALQAAIAACHAQARTAAETDWARIVALYDALLALTGSPVVALNRAVAVSMAFGPAEALEMVDELTRADALPGYHLLPAVRGDLLARLGRAADARVAFAEAASLAKNTRERVLMQARAQGEN